MSKRTTVRVRRPWPPPAIVEAARKVAAWVAGDMARALRRRSYPEAYYAYRRPAELLDSLSELLVLAGNEKSLGRRRGAPRRRLAARAPKSFAE